MPVIVVQGTSDYTVNPINADQTATFFTKLNTLIETGAGATPAVTSATKKLLGAAQGDYSSNETDSLFDGKVLVQKILVNGMGHAWSGGNASVQYMDPKGPSSTEMVVDLFFPPGNP
jgi:poly(3-hydroxybutyrate) depolymerase